MRTVILLTCLICGYDARRVTNLGNDAKDNTLQADNAEWLGRKKKTVEADNAATVAAAAPWESNNFASYSAGELNDAELGLANLKDALRDPSALSQIVQLLRDPENLAEVQEFMTRPSFTAQATRARGGSQARVREWELENAVDYSAGNISLAELGATNLQAALRDPSVMQAAVRMLRNPDNLAAVKKMSSLESFQQEAKLVAEEMDKLVASGNEHVPQSFAQVSEAKVQDGLEASYSPSKALALALGLLLSNPAAAFSMHGNRPLSRVARPSGAAISMQADPTGSKEVAKKFDVKDLAGVTEPLGFFDPFELSANKPEEKVRFLREAELKHGRVAMLAALGFLATESFGPLLTGDALYAASGERILSQQWPIALAAIAIPEVYSVQDFVTPYESTITPGNKWLIRSDHEPGTVMGGEVFDPLNLKPEDPKELKEMQNKELNNGRLAMIAIAGMVAQELATGERLFEF
jgi:hypothetical protein